MAARLQTAVLGPLHAERDLQRTRAAGSVHTFLLAFTSELM
jgi:hypothetical protein